MTIMALNAPLFVILSPLNWTILNVILRKLRIIILPCVIKASWFHFLIITAKSMMFTISSARLLCLFKKNVLLILKVYLFLNMTKSMLIVLSVSWSILLFKVKSLLINLPLMSLLQRLVLTLVQLRLTLLTLYHFKDFFMKNCVFTLYNNLSCRYGDVMSYPTEGFAQKVLSIQLPKMNMDLSEYELCKIGEIDVQTGLIEPCPVKRIPWNSPQPLEQKSE